MITVEKAKVEGFKTLKKNKKKNIIIITLIIFIVIVTIIVIPFIIKYCKERDFNQRIIENENINIELNDIRILKLWDKTIKNLKDNKKYIEIQYENYKIKLNTEKLEKENDLNIKIEKKVSNYESLKDEEILEIDISNTNPTDIIQEITINIDKYLDNLKKIDIYAVNKDNKTLEYIEKREIKENNIILELKEEYEKYILVYIPVKDIFIERQYIEIYKNEKYQISFNVLPRNPTIKTLNVEWIDNPDIVKIDEKGIIEGINAGTMEFYIKGENDTIKKKIMVVVKPIVEELQVQTEKIDLIEGESIQIQAKVFPEEVEDKRLKYESNNQEIAIVDNEGKIKSLREGQAIITVTTLAEPIQKKEIVVNVKKKTIYVNNQNSTNNQLLANNYINGILVVNKKYTLPSNYNPGVSQEAMQAFNNMKYQASLEGISLKIVSGYRSYQTQAAIFLRNANLYGEDVANTFSAKPGQSEHQTGLAFDINSTRWDFKDTIEAKWLAENCHKYGFIIRYPEGKQEKTGYVYEPWHIRYLGVEIATEIKNLGICLEEYLDI